MALVIRPDIPLIQEAAAGKGSSRHFSPSLVAGSILTSLCSNNCYGRHDGSRLCAEGKIDLTLFWCSCSSLLSFWPCLALASLRLDHLCSETGMKPTKTNRCWAEVTVSWKSSGSDATPSQRSTKDYFCLSNWTCLDTKVSWTLEQLTMKLLESGSCFSVVV